MISCRTENDARTSNIIIHGVGELSENGKEKDGEFVTGFLGKLGIEAKPASIARLGNSSPNKTRPLKLKMNNETEKDITMARLLNL